MPSTSSLETNSVLISSLARILEIEEGVFEKRCRVSVTSIGVGSEFSSVYTVGVFENGEEWLWFLKVVEGEGMVRGMYDYYFIFIFIFFFCLIVDTHVAVEIGGER